MAKDSAARTGKRTGFLVVKLLLPVLIVAVAYASFLALANSKPETKPRQAREKAWIVQTISVNIANHQPQLKLYGEAMAGRKVDFRALVAGEIIKASKTFREGGIVAKGENLLTIDPFEFKASLDEAKANLSEAKAKLQEVNARIRLESDQILSVKNEMALAERDLERASELLKQKLLAQKNVDDRKYTVLQRTQSLRQRISNLAIEQAKAAQQEAAILRLQSMVSRAERNLKNTKIIAPFNAYISAINAEAGRMISTNDRIATLIDTDRIDIRFNFSDAQYGRIIAGEKTVVGRPVKVVWRIGKTAVEYNAVIERVAAQITASSGGVEIYARLQDPKAGLSLRPGAFVEVFIQDRTFEQVTRLPETALYEGDKVFVINDKRRLEARKVELMGYAQNDILVRGALKPGDRVVTTRISQARDGLLVEEK